MKTDECMGDKDKIEDRGLDKNSKQLTISWKTLKKIWRWNKTMLLMTVLKGNYSVNLSNEERQRVRRWANSLIVKVFGKSVGYKYLVFKLEHMWKLHHKPCVVDFGHDFFLLKFQGMEDYDEKMGGPWFIGGHFLTMRRWVPNFRASVASFMPVVVWLRLPELSIEYFDLGILKRIGRSIGSLLRGRYARICV
ncbi:hypothetical protein REPUB_Repub04eG0197300 [Reevesia pubescens]